MPNPDLPGAGYPVLTNARHVMVYRATRETGAYSHHSHLCVHNGRFYAMWSNHPHGEDGPGQRSHYGRDPLTVAVSRNGVLFTQVYALRTGKQTFRVPAVGGRGGGAQYPSAVVHEGTLYVHYSMGKEDIWVSSAPLSDLGL